MRASALHCSIFCLGKHPEWRHRNMCSKFQLWRHFGSGAKPSEKAVLEPIRCSKIGRAAELVVYIGAAGVRNGWHIPNWSTRLTSCSETLRDCFAGETTEDAEVKTVKWSSKFEEFGPSTGRLFVACCEVQQGCTHDTGLRYKWLANKESHL